MKQEPPQSSPGFRARDAALLAVVSLSTFGLLAGSLEFTARRLFRRSSTMVWSCFKEGARSAGILPIPNSVCWEKLPESPLVEYRFNACGYRSVAGCGAKPAGSLRVVLIGSSFVLGYQVPYNQAFGTVLERKLSSMTGHGVEVDNHGLLFGTPRAVALHLDEALAAAPDLILWVVTPWDVQNVSKVINEAPLAAVDRAGGPPPPKWRRYLDAFSRDGVLSVIRGSRSVLLVQHLLFQSRSQYLRSYMLKDDRGVLAKQVSPEWRQHWDDLDSIAKEMADRTKAAGVPFAVTAIPDRAGALMISSRTWPAELDPFAFGEQIRSITLRHGAVYLDLLDSFRRQPAAEQLYYTVDGHLNGDGHALIARLLADRITTGFVPALKRREPAPSRLASR